MSEAEARPDFRELHAAVVPVGDLAAACRWYEETLGLEAPRRVVAGVLAVYATSGPTHLCLYVPGEGERPGYAGQGAFPNWRVEDAHATQERLVHRGVACTPVCGDDVLSFFTFRDPDGNRHDACSFGPAWLP